VNKDANFRVFTELVRSLLNSPVNKSKEEFFNILDLNNDKKVCERDMFQMILLIEDKKLESMMNADLLKVKQ